VSHACPEPPEPPETKRGDDVDELFGVRVADPYRWLEDEHADDVQAWMDVQGAHARAHLDALPARAELAKRFEQLFYYDAVSPPIERGGCLFYTRKRADAEKSIVYWREGEDGQETVLFDPNTMSEDGTISLGVWVPSWEGKLVAYALRENNADEATLHVRDVASGDDTGDVLEGAKYAHPSWLPDGSGFYYTYLPTDPDIDVSERPGHADVRFHRIGDDQTDDRPVHPATHNPETFIGASASRDGAFVFLEIAHGWNSTDVWFARPDAAGESFTPLAVGVDALFYAGAWDGRFYVLTNYGAPRYRVMRVDPAAPALGDWVELVAESDATLESARIVGGHLVLGYLRDAHSVLQICTLDGARVCTLPLPGLGSAGAVYGEPDRAEAYFGYSSFSEPTRIFRFDVPDGELVEWARVDIDADTSRIVTEQVRFASKDGTELTMFLLRRDDVSKSGDNPTVLYGYGGFNVSMTPAFSPSILPWLDRGGVYAVANLRGGGEYGEDWHKAGMLANKQNVFDDFCAAAHYLIDAGWTRPDKLAIRGGSNGGLLVGAAMTQCSELFHAVICAVPLLDMVRYHLFGSGRTWIPEYGNPEIEDEFRVLHAYSPYQKLEARASLNLPALLMLASDSDDRVDPMHARKFVAAARWANASDQPMLLRIERQAGHGGADMVAKQVEQAADAYAFLIDQLGA